MEGRSVIFTFATFETSLDILKGGYPNKRMWKLYSNMEDALQVAQEASGLSGGVQSSETYRLMTLFTYLQESAIRNVAFSLAIAIIVIFALLRDSYLAGIVTFCLYAVISLVFAEMVSKLMPNALNFDKLHPEDNHFLFHLCEVICGWTMNVLEAVCMSIAGGLSVDYVLHMSTSFHNSKGTAKDRVQQALQEMGCSVTSGAFTTLCSCISLLMANMLWFKLFGCFVAMVAITAFAVSTVALMALLAACGPSSEALQRKIAQHDDDDEDDDESREGSEGRDTNDDTPGA